MGLVKTENHIVVVDGESKVARALWVGRGDVKIVETEYILNASLSDEELKEIEAHNKGEGPGVKGLSLKDFRSAKNQRESGMGLPSLKEIRERNKKGET